MKRHTRKKGAPKILWTLAVVGGLALGGAAWLAHGVSIDAHRAALAEALGTQLGRSVALDGSLSVALSWQKGLFLRVADASLGNPAWASRPVMARIGVLELGVAPLSLLRREVEITRFALVDADIMVEKTADGQSNLDFANGKTEAKADAPAPEAGKAEKPAAKTSPLTLQIHEARIENSRLGLRESGQTKTMVIESLTIEPRGDSVRLRYTGTVGNAPLSVDVTGGALDQLMNGVWPFDAAIGFGALKVKLKGSSQPADHTLQIDAFHLALGETEVRGNLTLAFGGARPSLTGKIQSPLLKTADFAQLGGGDAAAASAPAPSKAAATPQAPASKLVFSPEPLPFAVLRGFDVKLDLGADTVVLGAVSITKASARLVNQAGRLIVSPVSFVLGGRTVQTQVMLDASTGSDATVKAVGHATGVDLDTLFQMGGVPPLAEGKVDVDFDLAAVGDSAHALASHLNGSVNVVMNGGTVQSGAFKEVAGSTLDWVLPGASMLTNPAIGCMAVTLRATNGVVTTNGLLLDLAPATVFVTGSVLLGPETLGLRVDSRNKVAGPSDLIPGVKIGGTLAAPDIQVNAGGTVKKVAGVLLGGDLAALGGALGGSGGGSAVPQILTAPGQNACVYTLDHLKQAMGAAPASSSGAPSGKKLIDDLSSKARDLMNGNLLNGASDLFQ